MTVLLPVLESCPQEFVRYQYIMGTDDVTDLVALFLHTSRSFRLKIVSRHVLKRAKIASNRNRSQKT